MDVEAELLKTMHKEELESHVKQKIDSFHGFLTREVALRLIAKEKGLLKEEERVLKLGQVEKGARKLSFIASVRKIWPIASYASGKRSRVLEMEDETGRMPLVLWNDDVELANGIHPRDSVKVRGAYERNGELHLGYSGTIEIAERAGFPALDDLPEGDYAHIRGIVSRVEGIDSFVAGTDTRRAFSFIISDGKSERRCVLWEGIERADSLQEGDELLIEDALINRGNIEISGEARMLSRRPKDMLIGSIKELGTEKGRLLARVDDKQITLGRGDALRFMGVEAADDIELSTILRLKKDNLINSRIAIRIEEKDGQVFIRG